MRPRASRFDGVGDDSAPDLIDYLDEQAATPFWRARKAATIDLLELRPGERGLDVGCGTGDDVRAMAARGAAAVGVDSSEPLVEEARRRSAGDPVPAEFVVGDALSLPFDDASFDGVRVERTLQHLEDAVSAVREFRRVARPGGRVVAVEPDWGTLAVVGDPASVGAVACRRWADAIRVPRVGRDLAGLMRDAGLERVEAWEDISEIRELRFADRQFALAELAEAAATAGELPAADVQAWLADLRAREAAGTFEASAVYVTARGFAPG